MLKYVSFDVYDTLIKRAIDTKEIYRLMERILKKKYNIVIKDFCTKRISAQKKAKKVFGNAYNIENIYSVFPESLSQQNINKIIKLEQELEIDCAISNSEGLRLYNIYNKKYKIICISDMYLDKNTISKILQKNGIWVYKLYVSCEENLTKKDKVLYKKVISDLKIKRKEILHIGDSKKSDYLNPKILGIKSKLINNKKRLNYYYDIGYLLFGPLIYEFCKFIKYNNHKEKLLFVAREGDFLCKCFNIIYPTVNKNIIYISRKSVTAGVAGEFLKNKNLTELIKKISLKRNESVYDFFKRIGLDINKYLYRLSELNIDINKPIPNTIDMFYNLEKNQILKDFKKNDEIFQEYIFNTFSDNNQLVDIGWKGSMQDLLCEYLNLKKSTKKIDGIYLGVMNNDCKKGFLFSSNNYICQQVLNYSGLLETIMMPGYGSTIGYERINGVINPIFDETEFSSKSMNIIKTVQYGVFDFLKIMTLCKNEIEFDKEKILANLNKFGSNPKNKDIKYFENIDFYDNGRVYHLVEPININSMKENFINTKWKTAYLKKIFKISFPYDKLVIFLRKMVDKNGKN